MHFALHKGSGICLYYSLNDFILKGTLPFEHLGVDFTEMKRHQHYRYLLAGHGIYVLGLDRRFSYLD